MNKYPYSDSGKSFESLEDFDKSGKTSSETWNDFHKRRKQIFNKLSLEYFKKEKLNKGSYYRLSYKGEQSGIIKIDNNGNIIPINENNYFGQINLIKIDNSYYKPQLELFPFTVNIYNTFKVQDKNKSNDYNNKQLLEDNLEAA